MNQAQQMNESLGQSVDEAAPARSLRGKLNSLLKKNKLSDVLDQLSNIASQGVEMEKEGPGQTIQNYGKAVPETIRKASDQAEKMEKRG